MPALPAPPQTHVLVLLCTHRHGFNFNSSFSVTQLKLSPFVISAGIQTSLQLVLPPALLILIGLTLHLVLHTLEFCESKNGFVDINNYLPVASLSLRLAIVKFFVEKWLIVIYYTFDSKQQCVAGISWCTHGCISHLVWEESWSTTWIKKNIAS